MTDKLTKRQRDALAAIEAYIAEYGYAPTVREVGERLGLTSTDAAYKHLLALEDKGFIRWDGHKPRAIVVEEAIILLEVCDD